MKNYIKSTLFLFILLTSLSLLPATHAVCAKKHASNPTHDCYFSDCYKIATTPAERAIFLAAVENKTDDAIRLLNQGVSPNLLYSKDKPIPLVICYLTRGNAAVIKKLLDCGLAHDLGLAWGVCKRVPEDFFKGEGKSIDNDVAILQVLIQAGIDVSATFPCNHNITPLMLAARNHPLLVARLLMPDANPSPTITDLNGLTALMHCLRESKEERKKGTTTFLEYPIIEQLVVAGADPLLPDPEGKTMLDYSTDPKSRCLFARHQDYLAISANLCSSGINWCGPATKFLPSPVAELIVAFIADDYKEMKESDFPTLPPIKKETKEKEGNCCSIM